ncbi:MAG: autoinducer 2 ABC transporter substrate-binding protein [Alkalispirochaeta sp.]
MNKYSMFGLLALVVLVALPGVAFAAGQQDGGDDVYEIVMVAKHEGISWFDDMRIGVEEFGEDFDDVEAWQIAPEGGDPARQNQMVEDLIAQGVDAILVVPNDPEAMIPVLRRAREAGIVVVSHEAEQLVRDHDGVVDYNLEAFTNHEFGRVMGEALAREMDYEGQFAGQVGGLTMETHMQWYRGLMEYIEENAPDMEFVLDEPVEDWNTEQTAYDNARELLSAYPDLKGLFGNSASSTIMNAQVIEELGLTGEVAAVGLTLPSMSEQYIRNGSLQQGQAWRPADAGYAAAHIAYLALTGQELESGVDLGKEGYEDIQVDGRLVFGNAPLIFNQENIDDMLFF